MTAADVKYIDLHPKPLLLEPNFDGYKLSLDSFEKHSLKLDQPCIKVELPKDAKFSHNESKTFLMFNFLFEDRFCLDSVYFVDESWTINRVDVQAAQLTSTPVFTIPDVASRDAALAPSIVFASPETVVVCDGCSTLYIVHTEDRSRSSGGGGPHNGIKEDSWEISAQFDLNTTASFLWYSQQVSVAPNEHVAVIESFEHESSCDKVILRWLKIRINGSDTLATCEFDHRFEGKSAPDMVCVDKAGKHLQIAGSSPFSFCAPTWDNEKEPSTEVAAKIDCTIKCIEQDGSSLQLQYIFDKNVVVDEPEVLIESRTVTVKVKDTIVHLGSLVDEVDVTRSNWIFNRSDSCSNVGVKLMKTNPGLTWVRVFEGDDFIDMPNIVEPTTNASDADGDYSKAFNTEQLEFCDDMSRMDRAQWQQFNLDLDTGGPTLVTAARIMPRLHSREILFSRVIMAGECPSLCLRHDVDALVWETTDCSAAIPWQHAVTFHALGYVQASKRERKYLSCNPSCQVAALAECSRRIFIYQQPEAIETALINRKTGRKVPKVAKQFVLSFDNNDFIQGMVCHNDYLYVLFDNNIQAFSLC